MEVITRDTEEVRAYFEALEEGMRYHRHGDGALPPGDERRGLSHGRGRVQAAAHHAENVAGLPHATADPVHIAAGQDALPPVGSAAYAGGELRGHAPKAQTGEKSNINARGCASGNAAKGRDTASEVPAFAAFCTGGRRQAVSRRERRTRFPSCLLSFFSSTLRCMAARLPEIARKSELTILLVTSA